jgi:putative tryptophan/tyrosine transport system substrate-binding protein
MSATASAGKLVPPITEQWSERIGALRGVKPDDLPVEQPSKFELTINLRTAKALDHEIPAGLVLCADRLIE